MQPEHCNVFSIAPNREQQLYANTRFYSENRLNSVLFSIFKYHVFKSDCFLGCGRSFHNISRMYICIPSTVYFECYLVYPCRYTDILHLPR